MPNQKMTREQLGANLRKLQKGGWPKVGVKAAAQKIKIAPQTASNWVHACTRFDGIDAKDPKTWPKAGKLSVNVDERDEFFKERQRYRDENQRLADQNRRLLRKQYESEDHRKALFNLTRMELRPPNWTTAAKHKPASPGIPILFFSDSQWGEVIKADEMEGVNEFNVDIARERYKTLIYKTIELSQQHMAKPLYNGIVYVRGGDMVSGEIHDELAKTNDMLAVPACKSLVETEAWGLETLKSHFGKVWVISVPGNHGRTTLKTESKGKTATNFDTLTAQWLESYFMGKATVDKSYANITFYTPPSGDAIINIAGKVFGITHGDKIGSRGGEGFIGPVATIARGGKRFKEYYAKLGVIIDYVMMGHFHTCLDMDDIYANGCLPGVSEYARDGRFIPAPAKMWLLFCHPKHGITCQWKINLQPKLGINNLPNKSLAFEVMA